MDGTSLQHMETRFEIQIVCVCVTIAEKVRDAQGCHEQSVDNLWMSIDTLHTLTLSLRAKL